MILEAIEGCGFGLLSEVLCEVCIDYGYELGWTARSEMRVEPETFEV